MPLFAQARQHCSWLSVRSSLLFGDDETTDLNIFWLKDAVTRVKERPRFQLPRTSSANQGSPTGISWLAATTGAKGELKV